MKRSAPANRRETASFGFWQDPDEVAPARVGRGVVAGHAARGRILGVGLHGDVDEVLVGLARVRIRLVRLGRRAGRRIGVSENAPSRLQRLGLRFLSRRARVNGPS